MSCMAASFPTIHGFFSNDGCPLDSYGSLEDIASARAIKIATNKPKFTLENTEKEWIWQELAENSSLEFIDFTIAEDEIWNLIIFLAAVEAGRLIHLGITTECIGDDGDMEQPVFNAAILELFKEIERLDPLSLKLHLNSAFRMHNTDDHLIQYLLRPQANLLKLRLCIFSGSLEIFDALSEKISLVELWIDIRNPGTLTDDISRTDHVDISSIFKLLEKNKSLRSFGFFV